MVDRTKYVPIDAVIDDMRYFLMFFENEPYEYESDRYKIGYYKSNLKYIKGIIEKHIGLYESFQRKSTETTDDFDDKEELKVI